MSRPVAEYVKAQPDGRYPRFMHEACFVAEHPKAIGWKQMMMNNFFKGVRCAHCNVMLQCKCNPFKISSPFEEECKHAEAS